MANTKIPSELIADSSITAAKLADGTITTADIADSNVTTAKIADSNVTTAKIGDAQVTTAKITDANVTTGKIADDAVTTAKMASNSVTSDTIASGITLAGTTTLSSHLVMGDNDTIKLGDSSDLQIYHDGSHSYIDEVGTGRLYIRAADNLTFHNEDSTKVYANFENAGAAKFYYNSALSLLTTTAGAEVREGLTVGSSANDLGGTAGNQLTPLTLRSDTTNTDSLLFTTERLADGTTWTTAAHRIQRKVDATKMGYIQLGSNSTDLVTFGKNASEYMRLDGAGKLGLGTDSPDTLMEIVGADPVLTIRDTATGVANANATLRLAESGASNTLGSHFDVGLGNNQILAFGFSNDGSTATEQMRLEGQTGNFGIGTSSLNGKLHIGSANATGNATNPALQIGGTTTYRLGLYTQAERGIIDCPNGDDGLDFKVKTAGLAMRVLGGTGGVRVTGASALGTSTVTANNVEIGVTSGTTNTGIKFDTASTAVSGDNRVYLIENKSGDRLRFMTAAGTEILSMLHEGNVGIGETSPSNLLHVKASDAGIAPHPSAQIVLERDGTNYLQFLTTAAGTSGLLFGDTNDIDVSKIYVDHNTTKMTFVNETIETMTLNGANVGIGTASPAYTLELVGDSMIGDASAVTSPAFGAQQQIVKSFTYGSTGVGRNGNLYLLNTNTGGDAGFLTFGGYYNNTNNKYYQTGGIGGGKETAAGSGWGGFLSFHTTSDGTAGAASGMFEHMRITADGNVGIGNTDPQVSLALGNASGERMHVYHGGNVRAGFGVDMSGASRELSIFHSSSTGGNGHISFGRRLESNGAYSQTAKIDATGDIYSTGQVKQGNSDGTPRFLNIPYASAASGFTFDWQKLANHTNQNDQESEQNAFMFEVNLTSYLGRYIKAIIVVDTNADNSLSLTTLHNSTITMTASIPTGTELITLTFSGLWGNATNFMGRITTF